MTRRLKLGFNQVFEMIPCPGVTFWFPGWHSDPVTLRQASQGLNVQISGPALGRLSGPRVLYPWRLNAWVRKNQENKCTDILSTTGNKALKLGPLESKKTWISILWFPSQLSQATSFKTKDGWEAKRRGLKANAMLNDSLTNSIKCTICGLGLTADWLTSDNNKEEDWTVVLKQRLLVRTHLGPICIQTQENISHRCWQQLGLPHQIQEEEKNV